MPHLSLYCSTGTIIGRVTGYDYRHILRVMPALVKDIPLDGLELIMLPAYLEHMSEMAAAFRAAGLRFPVIHADKEIGTMLSHGAATGRAGLDECGQALALWDQNCIMGARIGAQQIVLHLWGGPDSDAHFMENLEYLARLRGRALGCGLEVLIENVPCTTADPIANLTKIHAAFPDQRYVFDTRFASFHHQLESLFSIPWLIGDCLAHIHISDLHDGAERDFTRLRPILHPGEGNIDFPSLITRLTERGYSGSFTLESPVMSEAGIDVTKLAATLRNLRGWLNR